MKFIKKISKERIFEITKYLVSAGSSFAIDLTLFSLFYFLLSKNNYDNAIIVSTIIARIISSFYNYLINSRVVFKNKDKTSIIKYYGLVIIQMLISSFSVDIINSLIVFNTTAIKSVVDITIFIVNYFIQKEYVFK